MLNDRYSRQELLTDIGKEGQLILKNKTVAIVGIGALGTVSSELLTRAGIGNLILIDRDVIELSNLQRQNLFTENDLGKSKSNVAKIRLTQINSTLNLTSYSIHLNSKNISVLKNADLILDCTDNLSTRFLINDFCKKNNLPWIYAAAIKTSGQVMPILPGGPCLSCFVKETPTESCNTAGVLNSATSSISALQVSLALKILLGKETAPELYCYDLWKPEFRILSISKNKECLACNGRYNYLNNLTESKQIKFCSSGKYQIDGTPKDFIALKHKLEIIDKVELDEDLFKFQNILLFKDGRAIIKANSEEEALACYAKHIEN
ncbi:MAG: HesA/MoeB/ThiF family protein [archaeon]|nr:HesA/MoeB/ThiF family protein [archaeon]